MDITGEKKKRLFTMAIDMRTCRDTMLSFYDQSKKRKIKIIFYPLSMIYAVSEHGINSCFRTLGLLKEYADFIGAHRGFFRPAFYDAYIAEKRFINSKISYCNVHPLPLKHRGDPAYLVSGTLSMHLL